MCNVGSELNVALLIISLDFCLFYLKNAYGTTWKYGIMKGCRSVSLRGRVPIFMHDFLKDRYYKDQVASSFSGPIFRFLAYFQRTSIKWCSLNFEKHLCKARILFSWSKY